MVVVVVSVLGSGQIVLLRECQNDIPQRFEFASRLTNPHAIVFHQIDGVTYLYIAESRRVTRSIYSNGASQTSERAIVVDGLPGASTPELQGAYGHQMKHTAISSDHKLYVSILRPVVTLA